ncbi:MAG: alpha/beta hydrolase [Nanoarchaeota archaeon]|nr:alpha/beta hydrolase [Nanoarchaeota archaeon]
MEDLVIFRDDEGNKLNGLLTEMTRDWIVILVHGFRSDKNNSVGIKLTEVLNSQNISTFRFDMFGHGESDGKFEDFTITRGTNGILSAIEMLKEMGFKNIGLFGSSMGGICSLVAGRENKDIKFLALKAPVSDYAEQSRLKGNVEKWKDEGFIEYESKKGGKFKLKYDMYLDAEKNVAYNFANQINIPVFIVHGDEDITVPLAHSKKLVKLLPNAKLEILEGCDHWFIGDSFQRMILLVEEFIYKQVKG